MGRAAMGRIGPIQELDYDFKTHHARPDAVGRRSFVYLIWSTMSFGALPLFIILKIVAMFWSLPLWFVAGAVVMLVGGTGAIFSFVASSPRYPVGDPGTAVARHVDDSIGPCPAPRPATPRFGDQLRMVEPVA
jgi:hypothetical protein